MAVPTETVYGLAADARDPAAVARIFAAKRRPADNPLIVHVADVQQCVRLVSHLGAPARELAARWWPGPLTLVVALTSPGADRGRLAPAVTAGLSTVAVRCPAHPWLRALLADADLVLAAPSANISGRPSPTTAAHVAADLGDVVDLIVDGGRASIGVESTVVDVSGAAPLVLRDGAVSREELGLDHRRPQQVPAAVAQRSPGTRHRHYAPRARVEVVDRSLLAQRARTLTAAGERVGVVAGRGDDVGPGRRVAEVGGVADLAHGLFDALRRADELGLDVVLVLAVEERGLGRAVMDRLRRAGEPVGPSDEHA